ncbi:hypothetical protein SN15_02035 [Stenotrophomonas maltophilia]|nr:hypothetical protein SN15_02035 [Stenotrophomonas maltophilia]
MAIEFCPLAADVGNWADWAAVIVGALAAGGTIWAVIVAMNSSRTAIEEAQRMRNEDREQRLRAEHDRGVAMAIVLDHEIFMLGSEINRIVYELEEKLSNTDRWAIATWLQREVPKDPLPMLSRFAMQLDYYGKEDASELLSVLSSWHTLRDPIDQNRYEHWEKDQLDADLWSISRAFRIFLEKLKDGRIVTANWASEVRPDLPPTDW